MTQPQISPLPGAESFLIAPQGLGVALRISIARTGRPSESAPTVVYATDADYCFGTVVEAARIGAYAGETGAAIVVGIGYAEERGDYAFADRRRGLDFYRGPRRSIELGAMSLELGGADAFLAALVGTVAPEVERRVAEAAGARRLLLGMSAGGHFAAYALTQKPEAFQGYALISPALIDFPPAPGDEQLVEAVRAMGEGAIPPGTAVFLSAGAREEDPQSPIAAASIIGNAYRMRAALAARGARTELAVFADETHFSVMGAAIGRALRFLIPPRP